MCKKGKAKKSNRFPEGIYKDYLNSSQASRYLKISIKTLFKLKNNGVISHYRVGGIILFKLDDLKNFLESCLVEKKITNKEVTGGESNTNEERV